MELDLIGAMAGTDKSSLGNRYLQSYELLISELRHERFTLVEIGVFDGASLRAWKTYFPNAAIVGIDNDPRCKQYEQDRITVEIGSQADGVFLDDIMRRYDPLIVIDDGSHRAHHMQFSFETIFPKLRPGGLYIVEDLYMHFGGTAERHKAEAQKSIGEYFSELAIDKMRNGVDPAVATRFSQLCCNTAEAISFGGAFVAIRKKFAPFTAEELEPMIERYCAGSTVAEHLLAGAHLLLKVGSVPAKALPLAERAVAADPNSAQARLVLAEILFSLSRAAEAVPHAQFAANSMPRNPVPWHNLARYQYAAGDVVGALDSVRRAISLYGLGSHLWMLQSDIQESAGDFAAAAASAAQAAELAAGTSVAVRYRERAQALAAKKA